MFSFSVNFFFRRLTSYANPVCLPLKNFSSVLEFFIFFFLVDAILAL